MLPVPATLGWIITPAVGLVEVVGEIICALRNVVVGFATGRTAVELRSMIGRSAVMGGVEESGAVAERLRVILGARCGPASRVLDAAV